MLCAALLLTSPVPYISQIFDRVGEWILASVKPANWALCVVNSALFCKHIHFPHSRRKVCMIILISFVLLVESLMAATLTNCLIYTRWLGGEQCMRSLTTFIFQPSMLLPPQPGVSPPFAENGNTGLHFPLLYIPSCTHVSARTTCTEML